MNIVNNLYFWTITASLVQAALIAVIVYLIYKEDKKPSRPSR
jgi:hypothetical protein